MPDVDLVFEANGEPQQRTMGARSGMHVGVASLVVGASAYATLALAAHEMTPADNARFLLFWGVLFACFGTLIGLQSESTRAVFAARDSGREAGARVVPTSLLLGVGFASIALVVTLLLGGTWFSGLTLATGIAAFAGHAALTGVLAGRRAWSAYAVLVSAESLARIMFALVVVTVVGSSSATLSGLTLVVAVAAAIWLPALLVSGSIRASFGARADVHALEFFRRILLAGAAAAASTVLIVGYPALVRVTSTTAVFETAAPLLLAVMLTRAPLLLPLGAFQGVAITHFARQRSGGFAAVAPVFVAVGFAGAVFSVAWAIVGPPVLAVFGESYEVSARVFGGLGLGATAVALVTLSGAMCLATDRHRAYTTGWIFALVVGVVVLLAPWELTPRVVGSLLIGPLAGAAVHVAALTRQAPAVDGRSDSLTDR